MDERLLEFAETDAQRQAIQAVLDCGTQKRAAKQLGIQQSSLSNRIKRAKAFAAQRGYAPEFDLKRPCAENFLIDRASNYYNASGELTAQWVVSKPDRQRQAVAMKLAIEELKQDIRKVAPAKPPKATVEDLLNLYVISDAHIGMLAHHEETGVNWDTKIAEQEFDIGVSNLVYSSPQAEVGFLAQLGDGLHSDGIASVTPRSGHLLDQDGRFHKVVRAATRVFRRAIDRLLERHQRVVVLMMQGNHDPASSIWLQEMFSAVYENEPRVEVVVSPAPYFMYLHGKAFLGFHHGHGAKNETVADVFIGNFRSEYGQCNQAYIHTGHRHSRLWLRDRGHCIVEQHSTIIPKDAYATTGGWTSERSMNCITYSATAGREKFRATYHPELGGSNAAN
jgi:hypothetical protein